jgi:hypothetical protein
MTLYEYDKTGEYTGTREAQKRPNGEYITDCIGATTTEPPAEKDGYARVFKSGVWGYVEDHRQKRDKGGVIIEDSGTPYWLEGDTYQSQARYVTELGALPAGALLDKPEKPASVVRKEEIEKQIQEKQSWLSSHDYIGTKLATGRATAEDYAEEIALMKQYADEIDALRAELDTLAE